MKEEKRYKVTNEVYRIIGKSNGMVVCQKEIMEQGFIFKSSFSEDGASINYYKVDNSGIKEWK